MQSFWLISIENNSQGLMSCKYVKSTLFLSYNNHVILKYLLHGKNG